MLSQLQRHLIDNNLIETNQLAYRHSHSTETALLDVTSNLLEEAHRGNVSISSLLDLSAAFDTTDHNILLCRLNTFGIQGTAFDWFKSYMSDRHQGVVVNGVMSEPVVLKYGVPQGSVLGPILFSFYTEPLADILTEKKCDYHKFADDTQIATAATTSNFEELQKRLENCLDAIRVWMQSNKLKLNESKTEAMTMGTKHKCQMAQTKAASIDVGVNDIKFQDQVKNLGVFLDPQLDMKKQVSSICRSTYLATRRIAKVRKFLNVKTSTKFTCARILTRLDYCNSMLCGVAKEEIKRLQRAQNSAAKMVLGKEKEITPRPSCHSFAGYLWSSESSTQ